MFIQGDTINIEIKTGNAAFDGDPELEVSRILRELADRTERAATTRTGNLPESIYDINGNKVCYVRWD